MGSTGSSKVSCDQDRELPIRDHTAPPSSSTREKSSTIRWGRVATCNVQNKHTISSSGTYPANAGRTGYMPRATSRSTIYVQPRPIEHLLIEVQLVLQELQGHRTSPLLDVAHSVPRLRSIREKTRYVKVDAGEMLHDPSVAQSQLTIHLVEDVLLSSGDDSSAMLPVEGERHVDAVQRHPVNLALPTLPLPVRVAVAERADVHVVAVLRKDLRSTQRAGGTSSFQGAGREGRMEGMEIWSPVPSSPQLRVVLQ